MYALNTGCTLVWVVEGYFGSVNRLGHEKWAPVHKTNRLGNACSEMLVIKQQFHFARLRLRRRGLRKIIVCL